MNLFGWMRICNGFLPRGWLLNFFLHFQWWCDDVRLEAFNKSDKILNFKSELNQFFSQCIVFVHFNMIFCFRLWFFPDISRISISFFLTKTEYKIQLNFPSNQICFASLQFYLCTPEIRSSFFVGDPMTKWGA